MVAHSNIAENIGYTVEEFCVHLSCTPTESWDFMKKHLN